MSKTTSKSFTVILVLSLVTLGQFAIDIYLPSFATMVEELKTNKSLVQLSLSIFLISYGFSQLIYGPLSDSFGRRKVLLSGMLIFIVGSIGTGLSHSISAVLITRLIQGFGIGAANVLCRAILRDLYHGPELAKKTPYLGMVWVTAPIIAPVIGGYIQDYFGWRMNFVFLAAFVGLMWILIYFKLPETKNFSERHPFNLRTLVSNYSKLLANRNFLGYVTTDLILFGTFSCFYVAGPFLLHNRLGLSAVSLGWMLMIMSMGYMLSSFLNIYLSHRLLQTKIMAIGMGILFFITSIMLYFALSGVMNVPVIVIPQFCLFFGMGLIFTNCIAGCLSIFPPLAGSASALWGFFAFVGGTMSSGIMTFFSEHTQLPLVVSFFIQSLLVILVLCTMVFRKNSN